jgi:CxxC motif-containing protein
LTKKKWDILKSQIVTSKQKQLVAAKRISELNEKASAKNAKALNKIAVGAPIKIGAPSS